MQVEGDADGELGGDTANAGQEGALAVIGVAVDARLGDHGSVEVEETRVAARGDRLADRVGHERVGSGLDRTAGRRVPGDRRHDVHGRSFGHFEQAPESGAGATEPLTDLIADGHTQPVGRFAETGEWCGNRRERVRLVFHHRNDSAQHDRTLLRRFRKAGIAGSRLLLGGRLLAGREGDGVHPVGGAGEIDDSGAGVRQRQFGQIDVQHIAVFDGSDGQRDRGLRRVSDDEVRRLVEPRGLGQQLFGPGAGRGGQWRGRR